MRPRNGDIPVYSPIDVNATLKCVVNNAILEWEIDGFNLESSIERRQLNLTNRQIYEGVTTTSGDTTYSSVVT